MDSKSSEIKKEKSTNVGGNENNIQSNSQDLSVKDMLDKLKKFIDENSISRLDDDSNNKTCNENEVIKQRSFVVDEMYPITDSFLNQIGTFNKNKSNNNLFQNQEYEINIPKDIDSETIIKSLIKENLSLRVYSKDIEDELKELLKINEMLENENNDLEIKMKNDGKSQKISITEDVGVTDSVLKKFNEIKVTTLESILSFFTSLNSISEDLISEKGAEHYCNIIEKLYIDITKITNSMSSSLLHKSIEDEIKKNLELECFKYKNAYNFNITECINRMNELQHTISSLKKEKEVLSNENKKLKAVNLSVESDIGKQTDVQSFISISSDCQDVKSMYEMGSDNNIKNSKFSKLTNSAKKIIRNTSNKKLFKDKKSRSRGFSVSLPVKPIDDVKEETKNKRRNSIIDSSTMSVTNEIIPHLFVPHSYIKPTKCEICQELCWRKEIRCKTCGYRCHERCQAQAEKVSSCIVNKVQKANKISEMESQKKLFGTTISTYGINEIDYIPYIVKCCINEVEKRGLNVEGVYRKSGNVIKTRNLVQAFDRGDTPDISLNGEFPDISVITSTLKQYFRDLPEALIPEKYFNDIKEILEFDDEAEQVNKMRALIEQLPKTNYETLKFLSLHLNNVDANSDVNLMTSKNLGVVFGPTLIGDSNKDQNQNNMISTVCRVRAIDLIIRYAKEIFDYISDEEKNHISMDMLRDIENSINQKQASIDNVYEDEIVNTSIKNEKKSTNDVTPIAQL